MKTIETHRLSAAIVRVDMEIGSPSAMSGSMAARPFSSCNLLSLLRVSLNVVEYYSKASSVRCTSPVTRINAEGF